MYPEICHYLCQFILNTVIVLGDTIEFIIFIYPMLTMGGIAISIGLLLISKDID